MQPANDPSNNLVIYFHEYNQTSDQWESNFQESDGIPNQLFDVAISANLKFITMLSIVGSSVIEEGGVANGYSSFKNLNSASIESLFTNDNRFLFIAHFNTTIDVLINCNWNTSGNFYFNSNTSTCD